MADLSKTDEYITLAQLWDMATRVDAWVKKEGKNPAIVYVDSKRVDYVQFEKFQNMRMRYMAYVRNHGIEPKIIYIQAPITTNTIPNELKPYIKETKNCQVSNSLIQAKAKELQTGAKIFTFVRDAIEYIYYYNTVRGAARTITDKKGNCTDLSHLLIALARAAGIPARYVHCTSVKFSKITTGHVWVELHLNGSWVRADASNNSNSLGSYPHDSQLLGTVKRYAELPF